MLSAHPVEIVHLLYRVAIDNLNIAISCQKTGDNFGRSKAVTKAQKAVHELMFALDPAVNAPSTRNLTELYDYVQRQIIAGHTRRSEQSFEYALGVLTTLSEGWSGVRAQALVCGASDGRSNDESGLELLTEPAETRCCNPDATIRARPKPPRAAMARAK